MTVTLFSGRRAIPPAGSNLLMRHDLDAEHQSIGFWPGDADREAMFYGYLVPEPVNCAEVHIRGRGSGMGSDDERMGIAVRIDPRFGESP